MRYDGGSVDFAGRSESETIRSVAASSPIDQMLGELRIQSEQALKRAVTLKERLIPVLSSRTDNLPTKDSARNERADPPGDSVVASIISEVFEMHEQAEKVYKDILVQLEV